MRFKKTISGLCVGLMLIADSPKHTKAEAITIIWGDIKILGVVIAVATFWVAMQEATLAEHNSATDSLLKYFKYNSDFPIKGQCVSPDIKNETIKKAGLFLLMTKKFYIMQLRVNSVKLVVNDFCDIAGELAEYGEEQIPCTIHFG